MGHFCFNENYIPEYVQNTLVSLLYCALLLNLEKLRRCSSSPSLMKHSRTLDPLPRSIISVATERTNQAGDAFLKAYKELLQYLELPARYPDLKFTLSDVKFENSLAAIKAEKDLELLKDLYGRSFIYTQAGYDLIDKAGTIATAINSLNDTYLYKV